MDSAARRLLVLALVSALIGAGVVASASTATDARSITSDVWAVVSNAFASGAFRWLARAALFATFVAAVSTGLEAITSLRRAPRRTAFERIDAGSVREAIAEVRRRIVACTDRPKPDVVAAFDELVRGASSVLASDIHLSPSADGVKITYRVHGMLHPITTLDIALAPLFATRVKVLARLDTYVREKPQDGRLVVSLDKGSIEARVSTLPTEAGERIVLRLVRGSRTVADLDSLGFSLETLDKLKDLLSKPQGLLFVTGPVGSGKTTTLYAALKHIVSTRGRTTTLVTLEDPIELELPFATQTQMHPRAGMTFASVLRSVLRQDPNVLMIGEIRDRETAEIAMQAALTGHLFLTTVHGESAAAAFPRLIDIGIEPFVIASATVGCLSQRLVRTLCTACRREAQPEQLVIERFSRHGLVLPPGRYYEPVGCDFCEGQGFTGRAPITELLVVDEEMRKAVTFRTPLGELHSLAIAQGMTPLVRDGLRRAVEGETSLGEVLRVAG
jgi:general secretion pathway protein E